MPQSIGSKMTFALIFLAPMSIWAAQAPISASDTRGMAAASVAQAVYQVKQLSVGGTVYKIVEMDSALNGDNSTTVIVLVGKDDGSNSPYDAAFQVGPGLLNHLDSARVKGDRVELTGGVAADLATQRTISVKFNPKTKMLSTR